MAEKGITEWIIIITVISASLLELIDTTVVNVALTQMMGNLGATLEDVAWVITPLWRSKRNYTAYDGLVVGQIWPAQLFLRFLLSCLPWPRSCAVTLPISGSWRHSALYRALAVAPYSPPRNPYCTKHLPSEERGMGYSTLWPGCGNRPYHRPYTWRIHGRQLLLALDILYQYTIGYCSHHPYIYLYQGVGTYSKDRSGRLVGHYIVCHLHRLAADRVGARRNGRLV